MKVQLEFMTPREVVEARKRAPVAFVPFGPLEWHGPHLPFGTDSLHAHHVAVQVAKEVGGVVLPPFFLGSDTVRSPGDGPQSVGALGLPKDARVTGMDLPGFPVKSIYFEEGAFAVAVREIVRSLKKDDYRLIIFVNGHGAPNHVRTLQRLAQEETDDRVTVQFCPVAIQPKKPGTDPGHAERWETSLMMAIHPEHVRIEELPPPSKPLSYAGYGIVNGEAFDGRPAPDWLLPESADPRKSSRAEGEEIIAEEVRLVTEAVKRSLATLRPSSS